MRHCESNSGSDTMPLRKEKRRLRRIPGILAGMALGGALGYFGARYVDEAGLGPAGLLAMLAGVLVGWLATVPIHEAGHWALGALGGYRLVSYAVGPLIFSRTNGRVRLQVQPLGRGVGGMCMMLPPRSTGAWARQLYYAGGILANLLAGALGLALAAALPGAAGPFFAAAGTMNLLMAAINFTPLRILDASSDGRLLWGLWTGAPFARRQVLLEDASARLAAGETFAAVLADTALPPLPGGQRDACDWQMDLFRYFAALEAGDNAAARAVLEGILPYIDRMLAIKAVSIRYEACYQALLIGDRPGALAQYNRVKNVLDRDADANGLRVRAAWALYYKEDAAAACALAGRGLAAAERFPLKSQGVLERRLLEELQARARAGDTRPPVPAQAGTPEGGSADAEL